MISNNYSIDNINKMKITSKKYYCNDTVSDYHYFSTILFYVSTMYFLSYTNPIIYSTAFIFNILCIVYIRSIVTRLVTWTAYLFSNKHL